ncbi:MAG: (Fe-S)-binding protein, partial [Desulfarculus sp.]
LAERPFLAGAPLEVPGPAGAPRLGLFVGCLTNYLRPELAAKAVRLLSRRYTVVIPPGQGCCGLPAVAAGLAKAAAQLSEGFTRLFHAARVERVVTVCASCAHGLSAEAPRLAPPALRAAARELAGKVVEISQVLAEHPRLLARLGPAAADPAALHHPCHLRDGQGPRPDPAALLAAAGVELAEMNGADQCCGGGGLFALSQPELSQAIFAPRRDSLAASPAATLATSCSGCFLQWRRGLPLEVKVAHPIELVGD